jgi:SAM-dependent methyltransferase
VYDAIEMKITAAGKRITPDLPESGPRHADPSGCHPDTNVDEGHLGGYVRSRHAAVRTQEALEHGDPATWHPRLWRWAVEILGVRSVLDVGCGEGHAARFFRDLGCRVQGVDGSLQARRDSRIPDVHVVHDFTRGTYVPGEDFDLVWSAEFVEHVEERSCEHFLRTFEAASRVLMMTFAVPDQPGHHHVNLQEQDYWIDRLEAHGFRYDADRTRATRALASGHYARHGLFFAR